MKRNLMKCRTVRRFGLKHPYNEIFCIVRNINMFRETVHVRHDSLVCCLHIFGFVRRFANQTGIHDYTDRPNINLKRVTTSSPITLDHLRGDIIWRSTDSLAYLVRRFQLRRQTQISNFNIHIPIKKKIAKLQVSMDDELIVNILCCFQKLPHEKRSFLFGQTLTTFDHFIHALIVTKFKQNVAIRFVLKEMFVLANVLMLECPMDFDFSF
mmetsp:Transcript_27605/g.64811  ORF Transcript_27605/g.64811 Transcript_27605/m.64811 type:complete len:211 (+) Transcript_27605:3275-3907(+)